MVDKSTFKSFAKNRRLHKALKRSALPLSSRSYPDGSELDALLDRLVGEIRDSTYYPMPPRGYLFQEKRNGVPRIIPVFEIRDYCVYYYCLRRLEDGIANGRVEGTFGGWKMGNSLRVQEKSERSCGTNELETRKLEEAPYRLSASISKAKWVQQWQEFTEIAKQYSGDYSCFVKFDIANFYGSIVLEILERDLRSVSEDDRRDDITLLMHFLRNWDRSFLGYERKDVGIPQDELGDPSRLLANLYLQSYDRQMQEYCDQLKSESRFIRYADDQLVMTGSHKLADEILWKAATELQKRGLTINDSKVLVITCREDFEYYWAFDLFERLQDSTDRDRANEAARKYLERLSNQETGEDTRPWREISVFKRILTVGIENLDPENREGLVKHALKESTLRHLNYWQLSKRLLPKLRDSERIELWRKLDELVQVLPFNAFLYEALKVFEGINGAEESAEKVRSRLVVYEFPVTTS